MCVCVCVAYKVQEQLPCPNAQPRVIILKNTFIKYILKNEAEKGIYKVREWMQTKDH